jgi:hypothetical protein
MHKIVKKFTYKGEEYTMRLSAPHGAGDLSNLSTPVYYHVSIDNYFQGRIFKKDGKWQPLDKFTPNKHHPFIFDDRWFQRMGELIEAGD